MRILHFIVIPNALKYLIITMFIVIMVLSSGCNYRDEIHDAVSHLESPNKPLVWEQFVRDHHEHIDKHKGELTKADYERITTIDLVLYRVQTLEGLEKFTNVRRLNINGKNIQDITPLSNLKNLKDICLVENRIEDISPLGCNTQDISQPSNFTYLIFLLLTDNRIVDISPLGCITSLRLLDLGKNDIRDISPLSKLNNLGALWLYSNEIHDISVLPELDRIYEIDLSDNLIEDITPLAEVELHKFLGTTNEITLKNNRIKDISPLLKTKNLESVDLRGNPLSEKSINEIIPALEAKGVKVIFDREEVVKNEI